MSEFDPNNPEHLRIRYVTGVDLEGKEYRDVYVQPPMVKNELKALAGYGEERQRDMKFTGNDIVGGYGDSTLSMSVQTPEEKVLKTVQDLESGLVAMRGVTEVFREGYEAPGPDQ